MRRIICFVVVLLIGLANSACGSPTAKLTVKVVDEQGVPIQGAMTFVSFSKPNYSGIGVADILKEGKSDKEGSFSSQSNTMNYIGVSAKKEGYYHSDVNYKFTSSSRLPNRWKPWNPTVEVVLKKKRNPVPMYHKFVEWEPVPELNEPVGYDLEKGDWVVPYGKGLNSDFIFEVNSDQRAWTDYNSSYKLTFSNEKDGIQEFVFDKDDKSYYKWLFEALQDGYQQLMSKFRNDSPQTGLQTNEKKGINYIFRVRTQTDKDGKIIAAKFGKIEGEIRIIPGKINFSYYFNPDGTRNLEEDPQRNLFKNK
ncbi:MAG: hypothetical protein ABFS18_14710 [Thermodesulfobacteriota bacterium]